MKHLCLGLFIIMSNYCFSDTSSREKLIYIMPEFRGPELVEQCTRSVYEPESFWRVTSEQITIIEKKLQQHLDQLKQQKAEFIPEPLIQYKRQYIGFELNGQSYIYGNFFPKEANLENDPTRFAIVSCRGDKRYWGMLFNIDQYAFAAIERNDKLVKPPGALDPKDFISAPPERD
ncbi:MAG: hypothetical protein HWE13_09865 [Gammaproteobacteria bacterium]|nr:hypothetical protein [Gammaproteobacteria bacterium]NVK88424.1 hypothetical protein [Gammaproteobacteria bacterium]